MAYFYILGSILFTVYGQIILKWRLISYGHLPSSLIDKLSFLANLLKDFYILSGFFAAFIASLFWMAAMMELELSKAYPIITGGLTIITTSFAIIAFGESFSIMKMLGITLILAGVFMIHAAGNTV